MNVVRIYIGSALSNKHRVEQLWSVLEEHYPQLEFTYEWYQVGRVPLDAYPDIARKEYNGVLNADIFVGLLPGKKGTHTEFGVALATVPHVILLGVESDFVPIDEDNYPSIFYYLPNVKRYVHDGTLESLLKVGRSAVEEILSKI
jgi:hypothetical protein